MITLLALSGCRDDGVAVYEVPRESPTPPHASAPGPAAGAGGSDLTWTAPAGWTARPAEGMRLATFVIPTSGGSAELSVTAFPGPAGGPLANVNRWRGQLGLPPLAAGDLAGHSERVSTPAGEALVIEASGRGGDEGLLGAILERPDRTWFFKVTGAPAAVKESKGAVLTFLGSLHAAAR